MISRIYVLDQRRRPPGHNRDWESMLPAIVPATISATHKDWVPTQEELVIVHVSDFLSSTGDGKPDIVLAEKLQDSGCLHIYISGSGASRPKISAQGRGYTRSEPVRYPDDSVFSSRLSFFLAALKTPQDYMEPPWNLIEPPTIPEHLVAIYLLLMGQKQGLEIDFPEFQRIFKDAKVEYAKLNDIDNFLSQVSVNDIYDINQREKIIIAIRNVLKNVSSK